MTGPQSGLSGERDRVTVTFLSARMSAGTGRFLMVSAGHRGGG